MRRFTSSSLICDTVKIYQSTVKNVRKNAFLYSAMMSNGRIKYRRSGGESTHNFASFLCTSLYGVVNCQYLIALEVFDGVCQDNTVRVPRVVERGG